LRGFKAHTWEGGIRVPWIIQWKGHLQGGKVDDRPVIQLDILPTALAAAGVAARPEWKLDGVNLLPFLTGENLKPPHEALYWRFGQQIALRMEDWKMVKALGGGTEPGERRGRASTAGAQLYNLRQDIGERHNLADKDPAKLKEMAAVWARWNSELMDPAWGPPADASVQKARKARKRD